MRMRMKTVKDTITDRIIREADSLLERWRDFRRSSVLDEGSGAEVIFSEIKTVLNRITMGENSTIQTSMYPEAQTVKALKDLGYEYKKPIGKKLHFFNKETSVSLYYNQSSKNITLVP